MERIDRIEVIATSKIYNERVYIPLEVRKLFSLKHKDTIIWKTNNNGELIISKSRAQDLKKKRLNVSTA